ncbi:MAG TPA: aromatic acid exporter family protein, partial [Lachnospiraceae bacterium]|nr:aromatic acid exporter family protein [Lachnospiraceae bacterium]
LAFLISLLIAYALFGLLGYDVAVFGLYMLLFAISCARFKILDGLAMCAVLTTHFFIERNMHLDLLTNEAFLFLIGTSIGIVLNLYMPGNEKRIKQDQAQIEEDMRQVLRSMANNLILEKKGNESKVCLDTLEEHIERAIAKAYANVNNTLVNDTRYYLDYMEMRKRQCVILKRLYLQINQFDHVYKQHEVIADYLSEIASTFHETNNAIGLLYKLDELKFSFKEDDLPTTREEFESRAILYYIVNELQVFLEIKRDFIGTLSSEEIRKYFMGDM